MSSVVEHEQKPFLRDVEEQDNDHAHIASSRSKTHTPSIGLLISIVINVVLLSSTFFMALHINFREHASTSSGPYSPAEEALRYTVKTIDTHPKQSPFSGKPRLEVDQAWSQLLRGSIVSITEEEMRKMNKTSVALKDGGYIAYLESYHMLHCVKRLYQYQYRDYYPKLAHELTIPHLEHCMEVLRQGIMCNADVTANTYIWNPEDSDSLKGQSMHPRKCADWSLLQTWADERAVGRHHEKMISNDEPGSIGPADLL